MDAAERATRFSSRCGFAVRLGPVDGRPASAGLGALMRLGQHGRAGAAALCLCSGLGVFAQSDKMPASSGGIYTCTDDKGRKLTSDRPIAACSHKEQLLLNRDGSLRAVVPPTLTIDERAEREAQERRASELRVAQADAVRRDRNLMQRFKTEAAHARAREAALEPALLAMRNTEARLKELAAERVPLINETEFYKGKPLPAKIKQQLDANDAAIEAQQGAASTQAAEIERINKLFDAELERLRRLWGGAQPGSLGPLPQVAAPVAPASAARAPRPAASR